MADRDEELIDFPASLQAGPLLDSTAVGNSSRARNEQIHPIAHDKPATSRTAPQLRFITITNPEQDRTAQFRKVVRSDVARHHHIVR